LASSCHAPVCGQLCAAPTASSGKQSPGLFCDPPHTQQNGWIASFNGKLRDEWLNEEIFDSLADARCTRALWRYDDNNVRPHSLLGKKDARKSAPGA